MDSASPTRSARGRTLPLPVAIVSDRRSETLQHPANQPRRPLFCSAPRSPAGAPVASSRHADARSLHLCSDPQCRWTSRLVQTSAAAAASASPCTAPSASVVSAASSQITAGIMLGAVQQIKRTFAPMAMAFGGEMKCSLELGTVHWPCMQAAPAGLSRPNSHKQQQNCNAKG